ncbi:selT-like protein-like [Hibiscus syriacus]|uniref:RING-type E3 ubiquitin transferase n=1 Tax=Hibiscus syriacus TaxID=106335 RepID=A0A6A3AN94_HIBSY|nr:U-box domain-containing protein 44-like isoform X1 [Hibiscus syriacus]KAE8705626.1 selT-like protein-like [Hibiscus syriacus]
MTSPSPPSTASAAAESIHRSLSELTSYSSTDSFDSPRRFTAFASRLQFVLNHHNFLESDSLPPALQTALKGIASDLSRAVETVSSYRQRSKIFVLINCKSLSSSLQQHSSAIASWLALIESSLSDDLPDLRKKISDLSFDMKQSHFTVTENEERVHRTLQREGEGRQTSKAVQSAIILDLARCLGIDSDNYSELINQVKLLKTDLTNSTSVSARRILVSLEKILDNWSVVPGISTLSVDRDFEEEAHISPFKNFLCPLTKEVMKEPVVLESSQTYERTAIEYWFERCLDDGRDPTCPVTGQVLESLVLKPNICLAGAIEEWVNRNIEIQMKGAVEQLSKESVDVEGIERVLDVVYKISEEHPLNRFRVRNAGVIVMILKLLKNCSNSIGTVLRGKVLMALLSMSKDEESKKIMLDEGITRLAIHSLIGSSETEREYAVKLLLEFSSDESYCARIASEKGALVLLSSMAGNLEHPALANLAEEILTRMEGAEDSVKHLAAAGRFEPLLSRLREGPDDIKIEMASIIGGMTLTNNSKEQIARQCAQTLVKLLSKPEGRTSSLQALNNLSGLDENVTILLDCAVLPALVSVLLQDEGASPEWKELAASIIANIVSNPGRWELASIDRKGSLLQSGSVVFNLVRLLFVASSQCQAFILRILYGMASSPQAAESVALHIQNTGDGIKTIIMFLEYPEVEHRNYAFKLTRLLTERFGHDIAQELKQSDKLSLFKEKLLDNESAENEKSDAACILGNLPLSEEEVKTIIEASFVKWIVMTLKKQQRISNGRASRPTSSMAEGLLGLLLHFTRHLDQETVSVVKEHQLMTIFCEQFNFPAKPRVRQLAAIGLKNLSEAGRSFAVADSEPPPPQGFCASLVFMCGRRGSPEPSTCPIHNAPCENSSQLCLLKSNCIRPLADLLHDEETFVQIAAIEALSTLVSDMSNGYKRAMDELEKQGVILAVIELFTEVRPGVLQERALWMIERALRVDGPAHKFSLNQSLVRALVEAFKNGNANAKRHAQDALTNLKQISGVSGKASSQSRPRT